MEGPIKPTVVLAITCQSIRGEEVNYEHNAWRGSIRSDQEREWSLVKSSPELSHKSLAPRASISCDQYECLAFSHPGHSLVNLPPMPGGAKTGNGM